MARGWLGRIAAFSLVVASVALAGCDGEDADLTRKVKDEVAKEAPIEQLQITTQRRIVTLDGVVDEPAEVDRVHAAARRVPGVLGIYNRVRTKSVVSTTGAALDEVVAGAGEPDDVDRLTASAVKTRLREAGILDPIVVDVRGGVVALHGWVEPSHREAAVQVAREAAPEIRAIEDHLVQR